MNKRDDSEFWKAARQDSILTESLKNKLEFFENNLPILDALKFTVFRAFSYTCILDGYDHLPKNPYPILEHVGYQKGEQILKDLDQRTKLLLEKMPTHFNYLSQMYQSHLA